MPRERHNEGFILPIVIIVGLIIGAGLMALSARTFAGLMGSIRQGQSREAREIAESGMAIILKELNRNYPYLLIEDCAITSRTGTPSCTGWTEKSEGGTGTLAIAPPSAHDRMHHPKTSSRNWRHKPLGATVNTDFWTTTFPEINTKAGLPGSK